MNQGFDGELAQLLNDTLTLHKLDGRAFDDIKARVSVGKVVIMRIDLPIDVSDRLIRALPNGLREEFIVDDPVFFDSVGSMPAHFQVKVHRAPADQSPPLSDQPSMEVFNQWAGARSSGGIIPLMAFRPLKSFLPTADAVLNLELQKLGEIVLVHAFSYEKGVKQSGLVHPEYLEQALNNQQTYLGLPLLKEPEYGARQLEVTRAAMEAGNWLEKNGLVIENSVRKGWYGTSRAGDALLNRFAEQKLLAAVDKRESMTRKAVLSLEAQENAARSGRPPASVPIHSEKAIQARGALSQKAFARQCKISEDTVQRAETKGLATNRTIAAVCRMATNLGRPLTPQELKKNPPQKAAKS